MGFYFFLLQIFYFSFFHVLPPLPSSPSLLPLSTANTYHFQSRENHYACRPTTRHPPPLSRTYRAHIHIFGGDDCDNDVLYVRSSTTDILLPSHQIIHLGTFFSPPGKYTVSSTAAAASNAINASIFFFVFFFVIIRVYRVFMSSQLRLVFLPQYVINSTCVKRIYPRKCFHKCQSVFI